MPFTTFSLFNVLPGNRMAALRAFVSLRRRLRTVPGVRFARVMGSGRGAVFSLLPDWSRWAFLIEWKDARTARSFANDPDWQRLHAVSLAQHLHLHPYRNTGQWDGEKPFQPTELAVSTHLPVAVLTRARINPWRLPGFIRHSYRTSRAIEGADGLLLSLGMGEVPLLRQATLSVWATSAHMERYVYKDPAHREAMKRKRLYNWFLEDMFVRFFVAGKADNWEQLCGGS